MPRPVLQAVAALLVLGAAGSFIMGVIHAPARGRLPGERAPGEPVAAAVLNAPEATPLAQERIEGPPKSVEKPATNTTAAAATNTTEETATNTTLSKAGAAAASAVNAASATNATGATNATNTQPTNTTTPAAETPPF
ncbi:MAG: hypothetical protein KGO51_16680 [Alphaproteobacteria bacterium]|nr:hypothetical protein [Alphaproteobacteria bacterium]